MKKVVIMKFPYKSLYGGGEQHTIQLVEELQRKDFDFFLVTSCSVLQKEFKQRKWYTRHAWAGIEPVSKVALIVWPFFAPFAALNLFFKLTYYRIWKRASILYCLSLTEKVLITLPARLLGMTVVWVEHVTVERWLSKNPLKLLYRLYSRLVKIVAVSHAIEKQLVEDIKVPPQNISVIYSGVNLKRFAMRERRWEQSARFNIGCVARLEKEKGIEFLIQAVKIVREFVPFVRLIIVGEGSERRKLVWLSERLGLKEHIQWVGYQREIEKWYGYFDSYVLPSVTRESFGITLAEAMASGIPVVASRIGGTPEIIDHKKNGLLSIPGSSQDLSDQLLYLYNNRSEAQEMAVKARHRVEKQFSLERMVRDFYLLFRKE